MLDVEVLDIDSDWSIEKVYVGSSLFVGVWLIDGVVIGIRVTGRPQNSSSLYSFVT